MQPGSIVRFRERDWVLLPSDEEEILRLRPLTGVTDDVVAVRKTLSELVGYEIPTERIGPSQFPLPSPEDISDATSAHLLWQAARLTLRDGAAPLRSLGRISIRPRVYQFVPLLMALRLDPVRVFIADDVGVGKTIEALLVARELFDRGEVRRMAVLCPPYLCDQWEKEMREKFHLDAVVVRSSTIGRLERTKPPTKSIYEHYPVQVLSIDWVKSDRNKYQFLEFCPELVIVDEAHGAAEASSRNRSQQQRHELLREIARDEGRHLVLLTATPHSGVEAAFRSLLGLLRPEFRDWDIGSLQESQRAELARHFVQRTRKDIERVWEADPCFPERVSEDATYSLSREYRRLFEETYEFCREIVRTGEKLEERKRRVRYWGALALLRCVMSSPKAAAAALEKRAAGKPAAEEGEGAEGTETQAGPFVFEASDDLTDDENPTPPIEDAEATLPESDRRKLRRLEAMAEEISASSRDTKLVACIEVVRRLLGEGFHPIVWCRYVATADYVGEELRRALGERAQVSVITGRLGDEERRLKIEEIDASGPRVLVATDCLSEGINLQEKFTAVLHYDLPWNPNRLEQREGRVDRYGQTARRVKAIRFYGRDNPVDGAVIEVLLDKAREIHRTLGTYVPVPEESESVMEAVFNSLFLRRRDAGQLRLFDENPQLREFHRRWDRDVERERVSRTRFAQRALKPEEVQRELEATDTVLGDPEAVREFVLAAAERLGLRVRHDRKHAGVFEVDLSPAGTHGLPHAIRVELPEAPGGIWRISFDSPTPEGAEYLGRNHRFVAALARYLLEEALSKGTKEAPPDEKGGTKAKDTAPARRTKAPSGENDAVVSRCGAIRTRAVERLTALLLLRVRYLVELPGRAPLLAEEVRVLGYRPFERARSSSWLEDGEALRLLAEARPDANISAGEKRELVCRVLGELDRWQAGNGEWGRGDELRASIRKKIEDRARALADAHKRIRRAVSLRVRELQVEPQFPPDLLGLLVLQPVARR